MNFFSSVKEEMKHIRFWLMLSFGLLLILMSTSIEAYRISESRSLGEDTGLSMWFMSGTVVVGFMRELGFASLIALLIVVFVEHESRQRQEEAANRMINDVSQSVFAAVLGKRLPKSLTDETFFTVLDCSIIREYLRLNLIFDDIIDDSGLVIDDFVKIHVSNIFTIKNYTDSTVKNHEIRMGYPKTPSEKYKSIVELHEVCIGSPLTPDAIKKGYDNIADREDMLRYLWRRDIPAKGSLEVRVSYTLVKERSSNEVWRTLLPTLYTQFDITMNCRDLEFGAHALHRTELEKTTGQGNTGFHSWNLATAMLPHQAILVWWRPMAEKKLLAPPIEAA
ncbi:MAG: hypothetical protein P4M15_00345 [Alphaproteobacteria bacterium]|nr:hypothetical protein [Alphaproteobacteria bacterium]